MSGQRGESRAARFPAPGARLRSRADYQRCYRLGRRRHGAILSAYARNNGLSGSRFGITVTRKVGGAVVRNLLKRRLREIYRGWQERTAIEPLDIVLHARPSAAQASFGRLEREALELLEAIARSPS